MSDDSTGADEQDDELEDLTPETGSAGGVTGGAGAISKPQDDPSFSDINNE